MSIPSKLFSENYPPVAIIILNWNGWKDTIECIDSVLKLDYPNYFTILVDNGSTNDSLFQISNWLKNYSDLKKSIFVNDISGFTDSYNFYKKEYSQKQLLSKKIAICKIRQNIGFSGGVNKSLHFLFTFHPFIDYVFLLNNDAKVDPKCLTDMVDVIKEVGGGIIGPGLMGINGQQLQTGLRDSLISQFFSPLSRNLIPDNQYNDKYCYSLWVSGSAMLINVNTLFAIKKRRNDYFNTDLFMYAEDFDFCIQSALCGYKSIIARKAKIYNKNAGSSGGQYNPLIYYYISRNRIHLANQYLTNTWKYLFHLVNFFLFLARVFKMLCYFKFISAKAIAFGYFDGYKKIYGKWKYHDVMASWGKSRNLN